MEKAQSQPVRESGWLNTEDRVSEILYGLLMVVTFTCTISVTKSETTTVNDMLFGALSCNTVWGLVDAVMYLMMAKTEEERSYTILNFVRKNNSVESCRFITDALPSAIANAIQPEEVEKIRQRITQVPEPKVPNGKNFNDYKKAALIFLLVLLSALPVVVPFIFISDLHIALRSSNIIAILMMFLCGWKLGKFAGRNRFFTGITISFLGILLVLAAITLGG